MNQFQTRDDERDIEFNRWSLWTTGQDMFTSHDERVPFMGGLCAAGGQFTRRPLDPPQTCSICGGPTTGEKCGICIVNKRGKGT